MSSSGARRSELGEPSISAVLQGNQPDVATVPVRGVGPRVRTWLPELQKILLPVVAEAVRSIATEAGVDLDGRGEDIRHVPIARALVESVVNGMDWPGIVPLSSYASPSALDEWRGFLWAATALIDELQAGPPDRPDQGDGVVLIGNLPPAAEPEQFDLATSSNGLDSSARVPRIVSSNGENR